MKSITNPKLPTLLFWLAVTCVVMIVATVALPFFFYNYVSIDVEYFVSNILSLISALLLLCMLRPFSWRTKRLLFIYSIVICAGSYLLSFISEVSRLLSVVPVYLSNTIYASTFLLNFVVLAVLAFFLFRGRLHKSLLVIFCIGAGIYLGYSLLGIIQTIPYLNDRWGAGMYYIFITSTLTAIAVAARAAFIALALNVSRYPAEVRLRQLQCDRAAGKLDEASYLEQRDVIINSL